MSEYEYTITISRTPERVFSFVTNLEQLQKCLTGIHKIERLSGERIRVGGEILGFNFNQAGVFKTDNKSRRIDFSPGDGIELFSGWLQVVQGPDISASDVTAHLSINIQPAQEDQLRSQIIDFDTIIQNNLRTALESIRNCCEGHGDPLNEADAAAPA